MSGQRNEFIKGLKSSANEFDYYGMSFEDAIVRILEEEGMKKEIAQNADAKEAIIKLVKQDKRIPENERLSLVNIEYVRSVLKKFINTDGTIKGKSDDMYLYTGPSKNKTMTIIDVQGGKLVETQSSYSSEIEYSETITRTIENGIEMKVVESDSEGNKTTYLRNSDLVTATVSYNNKFNPSKSRGGTMLAGLEQIGGSRYLDFEKRLHDIDEARAKGETPEGFLYEGKDEEEIDKLNEQKSNAFVSFCEKSKKFKALAEKYGLIDRTVDNSPR